MTKQWTKAAIVDLLNSNPRAVERALLAIYAAQTAGEQLAGTTCEQNGVGFTGADANTGTWLVQVVIAEGTAKGRPEGQRLRGKALEMGRRIAKHYAGTQLLRAAKIKAAADAEEAASVYANIYAVEAAEGQVA